MTRQQEIQNKIREVSQVKNLTDKATFHAYDSFYPEILAKYPDGINILEIGIAHGGMLLILSELFPNSNIYGLDFNHSQLQIDIGNTNIKLLPPMDQCDPEILKHLPMLDVIIEDASHLYDKSIATFELLKNRLNPGGIYLIEDVYPEYLHLYEQDPRFKIYNFIHLKNRQDDVVACYET